MNKQNLFLATLMAIATINGTTQTSATESLNDQPQWKNVYKTYATTLISGGLIGAITSKLSGYTFMRIHNAIDQTKIHSDQEKAFFTIVTLISILIAENRLRTRLTNEVSQTFEENNIKHKKNLINDAAWIASWIVFLI